MQTDATTPNIVGPTMLGVKPRANGRYIVGQHLPKFWMLHVACCWELLRKVWKRSNFWANNSQHCWANDVRSKAPCKRTLHCCPTSPKILNVTCSVLLGVVKKGLKAVKLLSQQLPILLANDVRSKAPCKRTLYCWPTSLAQLFQHCCGHASALHMVFKVLRVVFLPGCTAGTNIVGSFYTRLQVYVA